MGSWSGFHSRVYLYAYWGAVCGITLRSTGRCAIKPRGTGDLHVPRQPPWRATILHIPYRRSIMNFSIECEEEVDGRWIAEIPELPGVLCYGQTPEEAMANRLVRNA